MSENLNEGVQVMVEDATVITVPIDDTLTKSGEAADAKAVGDALALKADASSVNAISVNGETADNQGAILINATDIPMSDALGAQTVAEAIAGLGGETAESIPMSSEDSTTVAAKIAAMDTEIAAAVKSVNSVTPDGNGDVTLNEVPLAGNLKSDQNQMTAGEFILRTTGGSRSVGSGSAQLQEIRGAMTHTGVVEEVLDLSTDVTSGIGVEIDHDTFVGYVAASADITITYDSAWKVGGSAVDLADYGITVTGAPNNGDKILITYVKADRGTITPATPTAFRATGWNLFNSSTGYARVAAYDGAYHVGGTYTELKYSATLNGAQSAITVENGSFTVPGDGYVWVTGGNATDTYITTEWTDWTTGPDVAFAAYSETAISLSTIMSTYFEHGLFAVGAVYDSISIDQGKYYSRIARVAYDADTLATLISGGIAYDADENYIYYVKTTADSGSITVNGAFTANDHGIEIIDGTEVAPYVVILYGQNLKAKLANDVLTISQQALTNAQKTQVRSNIGAADNSAVLKKSDVKAMSGQITIAANSNSATVNRAVGETASNFRWVVSQSSDYVGIGLYCITNGTDLKISADAKVRRSTYAMTAAVTISYTAIGIRV